MAPQPCPCRPGVQGSTSPASCTPSCCPPSPRPPPAPCCARCPFPAAPQGGAESPAGGARGPGPHKEAVGLWCLSEGYGTAPLKASHPPSLSLPCRWGRGRTPMLPAPAAPPWGTSPPGCPVLSRAGQWGGVEPPLAAAVPATLRRHRLLCWLLTETNELPVPATAFTPHCRGERGSAWGPGAWGQPCDAPVPRPGTPPRTSAWLPASAGCCQHRGTVLPAQLPGCAVGPRSAASPRTAGPDSASRRGADGWGAAGHKSQGPASATPQPAP